MTWRGRRRLRVAAERLRRRGVFIAGGISVAAAAVGIAWAADWVAGIALPALAGVPWLALLVTPAGFALSRYWAGRYFPNSGGSGIPQVIAARAMDGWAARARLVSPRVAAGKTALLLLGLACGASIGREGPTVQVGAAILFAAGRLSPRRQPGLLLAGACAGVAAAFNTPLAGIVFGIEEMSRAYEVRTSGIVIGAVIAAGLTSLTVQGDYTYFGSTAAVLGHAWQGWLAVPVLGVLGGLCGGGFSRVLIAFGRGLPGRVGAALAARPVGFAAVCGLVVALCGWASGGAVFGTGYAQARALVQGQAGVADDFGVLKLFATMVSSVSGIPGGIFAPSLAVGAGLGADVAALLPSAPVQALVVLGMVAYFSGVVQAPITAFVIVAEMTNDHALIVPLMLASVIAYAASKLVCPEGVYHALAVGFLGGGGAGGHPSPGPFPRGEGGREVSGVRGGNGRGGRAGW